MVAVTISSCGSDEVADPTTEAPGVETLTVPSCEEDAIACHLTKDSGVHGVPLPDDAAPIEGSATDLMSSEPGSISEVTQLDSTVMADNGWAFDKDYSVRDPDAAESQNLRHITSE